MVKVKKINEDISSEIKKYKDQYDSAKSIEDKCKIIKSALNLVVPGFGKEIGKFDDFFIDFFIKKFHWEEMKETNTFIKFIKGILSYGHNELFNDENLFSNAYNCYCKDIYTSDDLEDKNSVVFNPSLYKQSQENIKYILGIDDMLSTSYDIERNLNLENINSKTVSKSLNQQGIDYDEIVNMLVNGEYENLRKAIIYNDDGSVRDASVIERIIDTFKKDEVKNSNKGDSNILDKINNLDRKGLSELISNLDEDTLNNLITILKKSGYAVNY